MNENVNEIKELQSTFDYMLKEFATISSTQEALLDLIFRLDKKSSPSDETKIAYKLFYKTLEKKLNFYAKKYQSVYFDKKKLLFLKQEHHQYIADLKDQFDHTSL